MNHHVIVRNREISVVCPVMVQSNVAVDTVTVSVDSEYDGLQVALVIGSTQLMYDGKPVTVPSSELERTGDLPLTVLGLSSHKRVVTASAESAFHVVASGALEGENPVPDSPDMLQQLANAYKAANEAAQKVATASLSMGTVTTLEPGEQASATLDGEWLQKTLNLSIPKGDKGDKGDPGDKGDTGPQGAQGPQGVKGDKGDPFTYDDFTESQIAELQRPATEAAAAMAIPRFDLSAMGAQVGNSVRADTRSLYKALTTGVTKCTLDFSGMHFEWNVLAVKVTYNPTKESALFTGVFQLGGAPTLMSINVIDGENGQIDVGMTLLAEAAS